MDILGYMKKYGHEQLVICNEPETGLKALIAVHDTTLGPGCGGVRIWPYATEDEAVMDVLRLSRAMTYKSAAAGLNLGGGKGIIWANPHTEKTPELLRAFGRCVETQGGRYITTEDVGVKPNDLGYIAEGTQYIVGLPPELGGSGDTSPLTGLGIYLGMKAAAKAVWGTDSLNGRIVAMQGFGNVGSQTARHLIEEGVTLIVTDIYEESRERAKSLGASIVDPGDIYDVECDIFSPCALGGIINDDTIPRLKSKVVAGGANNQLLEGRHGDELHRRGILYAPDYIINAGGIIQVASEMEGGDVTARARRRTEGIYDTMERVVRISRDENIPTYAAADRLAERRIEKAKKAKTTRVAAKV